MLEDHSNLRGDHTEERDGYDKTITMVASGGHENSLNSGIKRAKTGYLVCESVLIYTRKRKKTNENMVSYPGTTLNALLF